MKMSARRWICLCIIINIGICISYITITTAKWQAPQKIELRIGESYTFIGGPTIVYSGRTTRLIYAPAIITIIEYKHGRIVWYEIRFEQHNVIYINEIPYKAASLKDETLKLIKETQ